MIKVKWLSCEVRWWSGEDQMTVRRWSNLKHFLSLTLMDVKLVMRFYYLLWWWSPPACLMNKCCILGQILSSHGGGEQNVTIAGMVSITSKKKRKFHFKSLEYFFTLETLTHTSHLFAICPDVTDEPFMWVLFNNWKNKSKSTFIKYQT